MTRGMEEEVKEGEVFSRAVTIINGADILLHKAVLLGMFTWFLVI